MGTECPRWAIRTEAREGRWERTARAPSAPARGDGNGRPANRVPAPGEWERTARARTDGPTAPGDGHRRPRAGGNRAVVVYRSPGGRSAADSCRTIAWWSICTLERSRPARNERNDRIRHRITTGWWSLDRNQRLRRGRQASTASRRRSPRTGPPGAGGRAAPPLRRAPQRSAAPLARCAARRAPQRPFRAPLDPEHVAAPEPLAMTPAPDGDPAGALDLP
jgi:hypothetical protein